MFRIAGFDDDRLTHLKPEIVAFAGALADSRKYGESAVLLSNVVNVLHNDDGFTHAGAAKQPDLAALQEWLDEINDFHAGLKHFRGRRLLFKRWRETMDWVPLFGGDGAEVVHGLADYVHHAAQSAAADGNRDRPTLIDGFHPANHALGCFHGNRAHTAFAQMLLDFEDNIDWPGHIEAIAYHTKGLVNGRHGRRGELHVHSRAGDLNYVSDVFHRISFLASSY